MDRSDTPATTQQAAEKGRGVGGRFRAWVRAQTAACDFVSHDVILTLSPYQPGATILDIGCGDGGVTRRVADAVGAARAIGIDVVVRNVQQAKVSTVEPILANVDGGIPLRDNSIDFIILSHVIEHVADTDRLVKECFRVLKPRGAMVVATPNLAAMPNIIYLLFGKQPAIAEVSDEVLVGTWSVRGQAIERFGPAHRRIFTPGALVGLLEYHGFKRDQLVMQGFAPLRQPLMGIAGKLLGRYAWNMIVRVRKP